jgi:GT2 family glycosyltransferase
MAHRGTFVCGSRVIIEQELTESIIDKRRIVIKCNETGLRHTINGHRIPLLIPFFSRYKAHNGSYARSCNMACWRDDLLRVNGYNEDIRGWGREDSELSWRLMNAGIKKRFLKFGGIQYHLYHSENEKGCDPRNIALMERTAREHISWIPNGIVKG